MKPVVLGFAGPIGSGKSAVSRALAASLGWPRVAFGDYVRAIAGQRGLELTRPVLQEVGSSLINAGWDDFVLGVLAQAERRGSQGLLVDGIRHVAAIATLRKLVHPIPVLTIYLEAGLVLRRERLLREGRDAFELELAEMHPVETELERVRVSCDGRIEANGGLDEVVIHISRYLAERVGEA